MKAYQAHNLKAIKSILSNDKIDTFNPTHTTKHGFGELLREGVKVQLIKTICDIRAVVKDSSLNVWHGAIEDLREM